MKKFNEWLTEFSLTPGVQIPRKGEFLKDWGKAVEKAKKKLPAPVEVESEYDPEEEEIYASLIQSLQSLLDVLDMNRSDVVAVQQGIAKAEHLGHLFLKHMETKHK